MGVANDHYLERFKSNKKTVVQLTQGNYIFFSPWLAGVTHDKANIETINEKEEHSKTILLLKMHTIPDTQA